MGHAHASKSAQYQYQELLLACELVLLWQKLASRHAGGITRMLEACCRHGYQLYAMALLSRHLRRLPARTRLEARLQLRLPVSTRPSACLLFPQRLSLLLIKRREALNIALVPNLPALLGNRLRSAGDCQVRAWPGLCTHGGGPLARLLRPGPRHARAVAAADARGRARPAAVPSERLLQPQAPLAAYLHFCTCRQRAVCAPASHA